MMETHEVGTPAPEKARRRRLAALDTQELVELWDAPMSASSRALVLAELTHRGYRTAALPAPPPDDPSADPLPAPAQQGEGRIRGSVLLLLLIAIVHLLVAAFWFWKLRESGPVSALQGACIPLVLGVVFLVLHRRARARPHPTLTVAFVVFAALKALDAAYALTVGKPVDFALGLPATVLVLLGLGLGALASRARPNRVAAGPEPTEAGVR